MNDAADRSQLTEAEQADVERRLQSDYPDEEHREGMRPHYEDAVRDRRRLKERREAKAAEAERTAAPKAADPSPPPSADDPPDDSAGAFFRSPDDPPGYRVGDRQRERLRRERAEREAAEQSHRPPKRPPIKASRSEPAQPPAQTVDAAALRAKLADCSTWDDSALALLARIEGGEDARIPTFAELVSWRNDDCPEKLAQLCRFTAAGILRDIAQALDDSGEPFSFDRDHLLIGDDGLPHFRFVLDLAGADGPVHSPSWSPDDVTRLSTPGGMAAATALLVERGDGQPAELSHLVWRSAMATGARPRHPLAPWVVAWQQIDRAVALNDAKARTAGGSVRLPYAASEMTLRTLRPADVSLDAIEVDHEPLSTRLEAAQTRRWVYHDGHPLFDDGLTDDQGQLVMQGVTRFPQDPRDAPLIVVAQHQLAAKDADPTRSRDGVDYRKSVFHDLRIIGWVTYASPHPIIWDDESGARVLVTDGDGAPRKPREDRGDYKRFRNAADAGDGLRLYYRDENGLVDFLRYFVMDPLGDGRRIISKAAWFIHGYQGGYTLSAEHHHARRAGTNHAYPHLVTAAEYHLARSFDGEKGVAALLRPVRRGGPGPWVDMPWKEALQRLLGQRWDRTAKGRNDRALRRFDRIAEGLIDAHYTKLGEAGNGDTVEFRVSPSRGKKSGSRPRTIGFRSTARGIEAAGKAAAGEWSSSPLLDHFK